MVRAYCRRFAQGRHYLSSGRQENQIEIDKRQVGQLQVLVVSRKVKSLDSGLKILTVKGPPKAAESQYRNAKFAAGIEVWAERRRLSPKARKHLAFVLEGVAKDTSLTTPLLGAFRLGYETETYHDWPEFAAAFARYFHIAPPTDRRSHGRIP